MMKNFQLEFQKSEWFQKVVMTPLSPSLAEKKEELKKLEVDLLELTEALGALNGAIEKLRASDVQGGWGVHDPKQH